MRVQGGGEGEADMTETVAGLLDGGTTRPTNTGSTGASPVLVARMIGILLLVMAVGAGFAEMGVRRALVVPGDAGATAARILASEQLFRFGFVGYLLAFLSDVPVAVLFYVLLGPVSRPLALTAAAFRLVYAAVAGANLLNYLGALCFARGAKYLEVFERGRTQALALFSMDMFKSGFGLALVFFAVHLLLLAVLLFRSSYFPRILGVFVAVAGLAYLTDSLTLFLFPALNAMVAPYLAVPAMFEVVLALWLVVKGVKVAPAPR
jgi:hypothetical protein